MGNIENNPQIQLPEERAVWPDKPWLSIWTQPRSTIRAIVETDPGRHVMLLAALAGIGETLSRASSRSTGDDISLIGVLLLALIIGPLGGIISIYISGAILSWLGGLFGGRGSVLHVRAAIAWAAIPLIFGLLLWILELAMYGEEMFTSTTPQMDNQPWGILIIWLLQLVLAIWAFILFLKCLGEVHGFSVWKAFLVSMIPGLVLGILIFGWLFLTGVI